jgi:argininosuccinate lyase
MPLWGGRFSQSLDQQAWQLNASIGFDRRLAAQDVRGSQAWAAALAQAGVLQDAESEQIAAGLEAIQAEFSQQRFAFQDSDEDIHSAVERRLGELIGPLAGKLHTGRSRNDQVATDLRLWLLDAVPALQEDLHNLQAALLERAETDFGVIMPGYTHLQRAQPILLSHWWLSHFWPLQRDHQRLAQLTERCAVMPLGAAALAGTSFPIDRQALAASLGFNSPAPNSLDAISDRDFVAEFLFWAALTGVHLSHLAEAVVLFTSAEFGFLELQDAFATGSSLMPQKKNADVFELTRGKAGTLIGSLAGLLAVLKGLPSTYDKDLQEDKQAIFTARDTLAAILPVMAGALQTIQINPQAMAAAVSPAMMATDLADALVSQGMPFREAHHLVGQAVQLAARQGKSLAELELADYQNISPCFGPDVYQVLDAENSVARHNVLGGTAPQAVKAQMGTVKQFLTAQYSIDIS